MAVALQPPVYAPFDCKSEGKNVCWTKWVTRLEKNVFGGCNIKDHGQKKGLMMMYGGDDLNDILDTLDPAILEPADGAGNDVYSKAKKALTEYFNPKSNIKYQKYIFCHTYQQTDDIDDLYTEVKQLAETCGFADKNAEIKAQIIAGCLIDKVRDKGIGEPNLTLDKLLQYARTIQQLHIYSATQSSELIPTLQCHHQQHPFQDLLCIFRSKREPPDPGGL